MHALLYSEGDSISLFVLAPQSPPGHSLFVLAPPDIQFKHCFTLYNMLAHSYVCELMCTDCFELLTNLQTSFNAIQLSFRGLHQLLNASKTKCMLFNQSLPAPARPSSITTLDSSDLEYVDNYKYLGV